MSEGVRKVEARLTDRRLNFESVRIMESDTAIANPLVDDS